ncbi:hypothetical protein WMF18_17645 [Sorangium sp. So ce315]|uniref:hypothetical protein n=1 Tax=Sorangium sp. So ce315 TaxID=3133299 RepID=UPI003F629AEB
MGRARAALETWFGAGDRRAPRRRLALTGRRALALAALAALAACEEGTRVNDDEQTIQTSITIDPLAFLGDVRCSNEPGAIRSYVATLTDESATGGPVTLASSPPIPCSSRVSFTFVVAGHEYTARIDGYEQYAEELTPVGDETSGSRHMLLDGAPVAPRWTWACPGPDAADAADKLVAATGVNVVVQGCAPLSRPDESASAAIMIDPASALGALRCDGDGGAIASFDVVPQGGALAPVLGVGCPPAEPVVYDLGVDPGRAYSFRLEAKDAAGDLVFGSSCFAATSKGITVTATCDPLSATGALELDLGALLADEDLACGAGASTYTATLPLPQGDQPGSSDDQPGSGDDQSGAEKRHVGPVPCGDRALLSALVPGAYEASVEVLDAGGGSVLSAACSGEVRPGATTRAACVRVEPPAQP